MSQQKGIRYIVYHCYSEDGELLYVGAGKEGRESHVTSGVSHNYDLNRLHFSDSVLDVKIVKIFNDKKDAFDCETDMIKTLKPKFNVRSTGKHTKLMQDYNLLRLQWEGCFKLIYRLKGKHSGVSVASFVKPLLWALSTFKPSELVSGVDFTRLMRVKGLPGFFNRIRVANDQSKPFYRTPAASVLRLISTKEGSLKFSEDLTIYKFVDALKDFQKISDQITVKTFDNDTTFSKLINLQHKTDGTPLND